MDIDVFDLTSILNISSCMQFLENCVLGVSDHHSDGHQNFTFLTNFHCSSYLYVRIHRECLSKSVKTEKQT